MRGALGPLDHVYYWTSDMDRAVAFYRDVVGLRLIRQDGPSWAEFEAGDVRLALHGAVDGHPVESGGATAVFRVGDLDAARQALEARGAEFTGEAGEVEGLARFASFLDPDGNRVQIIEYAGGTGGVARHERGSRGTDGERIPRDAGGTGGVARHEWESRGPDGERTRPDEGEGS